MTISVTFIYGSRKSACNNDAYAVISKPSRDEPGRVLDIIPAYELGDKGATEVRTAFQQAVKDFGADDKEAVSRAARKKLRVPAP